jgi:ribonuclease Z
MPHLLILGSSNAIPTEDHDNTHMILLGEERVVLIDCASNPVVRLRRAGIDPLNVTDLILTHFHPDHVSGVALFLMDIWLLGRKKSINIHGLQQTIDKVRRMMDLYDWQLWPGFYPVDFLPVEASERAPVMETDEFRIFASPVEHMIPNIGLRMEFPLTRRVLAYSCDTMPAPAVVDLADQADVLIHESTGEYVGHSSAEQAGAIARQAGAKKLYLIHYPTWDIDPERLVQEAKRKYLGPVELAVDFQSIEL